MNAKQIAEWEAFKNQTSDLSRFSNFTRQSEAIMTNRTDFLKQAVSALEAGSENFADMFMQRSDQWLQRAQTLALLSLAQDVRRVADALESVVEQDGDRVVSAAVRIWGSGNS